MTNSPKLIIGTGTAVMWCPVCRKATTFIVILGKHICMQQWKHGKKEGEK